MKGKVDILESDLITVSRLGSIWLISKIFGLFPLMSMSSRTDKFKSSNSYCVDILYTLAWIAVFLVSFGCAVIVNPLKFSDKYPLVCVVGNFIQIFVALTATINSYGFSSNKGELLYNVWHRIDSIDRGLDKIGRIDTIDFVRLSTRFQNICMLIGVLVYAIIIIYDNWIFSALYGKYSFVICFSYIFPYIVSTLVILQFITIVNLVLIRLKFLNSLLYDLLKDETASLNSDKAPTLLNTIQPIYYIFEKGLRNKLKSQIKVTHSDERALYLNLDKVFDLHDQLMELCNLANENYSTQVVTFVTGAFVVIIFGLFFELKVLFWVWNQQSQMVLYASSYLYWAIVYACLIYALLNMCTRTRDEARESAFIAHKILQAKPFFLRDDDKQYNKIKSFTLQLLHQKNTFHFHGLGLFDLDYTFIFSTVSAATSYLIVLLQFDMSDSA